MSVVSISVPDALLAELDSHVADLGYAGRSEFVRAALRDFVQARAADSRRKGRIGATLTIAYAEEGERRVAEIKHTSGDLIRSMLHAHVRDHASCIEVLVLEGEARELNAFADALRGVREVKSINVFFL